METKTGPTDVIIIGGSHAGLSAALTLYRAAHTSLIFDAGNPRNAISSHAHMTPGWDHHSPGELREAARKELLATGLVKLVPRQVVSATKGSDGLFEVVDSEGEHWKSRKILLALGVMEDYPSIKGYPELYGRSM
jgi:gliotoxin/aspirochlorine biosynthesis thioredoxin reductase